MMDTTAYRFRTAVGGFHKGDVTDYIGKTAALHRAELKECQDRISILEQENAALQLQLQQLSASEPETQEATPESPEAISELELQAYRRAEATERLANMRAQKVYQRLEAICQATRLEFSTANTAMEQTVNTVLDQAKALRDAYEALSAVLLQSQDQLSSMDAMIPDPTEELEAEAWLS